MPQPNCPSNYNPNIPIPPHILNGPSLNVTLSESDVCGHNILMTFLEDVLIGIHIEKDGAKVFSYLKAADSVQLSRKVS